ncbi:hypothetical protein [Pontibaca salina]|uniref:Uncharacterized protein n=1 Tax=Pontibaca salina TaxID=2795731 RepID=A0A934HTX6_9RHOB|nr:hypothetical protein [Pontibaca salina]MBI6630465.1 hypothetical protein [Pontibaca salina]
MVSSMRIAALLAVAMFAGDAYAQEPGAVQQLCVQNAAARTLVFAVEVPGSMRLLRDLAPGERLCTVGAADATGVVSVYETRDAIEGCSRLASVGATETLHRYVEFDRCFWASNS